MGFDLTVENENDHTKETVEQLAALYAEHDRSTTAVQRFADRSVRFIGRPGFVAAVLALVLAWMIGNYLARYFGWKGVEAFPFPDLALVATVAAFIAALLILTTQRHEDELAERRSQLTLEIALLSEKKVSKIIELLEELRRESPLLASRADPVAEAMAKSSDPAATLERIASDNPRRS